MEAGVAEDGFVSDCAHVPAETKAKSMSSPGLTSVDANVPEFMGFVVEDTDVIEYLAYGSNMNLSHLHKWLGRFGVKPDGINNPRRVILPDHRLRTNYLTTSGLGAANVEPSPGDVVEGLLLKISPEAQEALRGKEG